MKKCTKCGIEKGLSEFSKGRNQCRDCKKAYHKAYRKENYKKNSEYYKKKAADGREKNREYSREYAKKYRKENPEKIRKYLKENAEKMRCKRKENVEKNRRRSRRFSVKNREKINKKLRDRRESDPGFGIAANLRSRVRAVVKYGYKSASTLTLLGCTMPFLKAHLKNQFTKGMTFENYGTWHIDHIIPCASFDLEIPEQQKICFNYRNLQPLWAKDNLSKGGKLPPNPQTSLPI